MARGSISRGIYERAFSNLRVLRPILFSAILLLVLLLAVMGRNLWSELEELSTAGNENAQWTIQQLDAEIATLYATLLEQRSLAAPGSGEIRLRTEIVLSRIGVTQEGNAGDILSSLEEAQPMLASMREYASGLAALIDEDATISADDLDLLIDLTAAARPVARQLALLGITEGAARTEAARTDFRSNLRAFGTTAIVVIGLLTLSLVAVNILLSIAQAQRAALEVSGVRLKSTVAASLDAVFVTDNSGRITDVNPAGEAIFGYRRQDLIGMDFRNALLPHEDGAAWFPDPGLPADEASASVSSSGYVELSATRSSGEDFTAEVNFSSVMEDAGRINVIYMRDISDRKLSEERLIEAKERAERTDRAKSRFVTVMSHEMRTPLNGILGVHDLMRRTPLSRQQRDYLDLAAGSGEILLRLIDDALDITRIEAGGVSLSPVRFNLAESVGRLVDVLAPLGREKGIAIDFEVDPAAATDFVGDGRRINQIATNLIGNAIKFTESGAITISLTGDSSDIGTVVSLAVKDTGPGISEDHLEVIFEDYVAMAKSAGRQERGDGLGLSISRKIARQMGGDLTVVSAPGQGSVFTLTVPLVHAVDEACPTVPAEDQPETRRRILVVDDNALNRSVLTELLEAANHDVEAADDGYAAVRCAAASRYDAIVMDINMPGLNGIEATRLIRSGDGPNRNTHIQGLTAYGPDEFRDPALDAGMNGLSSKPIRLAALEQAIFGRALANTNRPTSGVDRGIVDELQAALGPVPLQDRVDRFFKELTEGLLVHRDHDAPLDYGALGKFLHQMRGAAALFGFVGLEEALAGAEGPCNAEDVPGMMKALDAVAVAAAQTRGEFSALERAWETRQPKGDLAGGGTA